MAFDRKDISSGPWYLNTALEKNHISKMDPNALDPHLMYVTPIEEAPKLNQHQAFYQWCVSSLWLFGLHPHISSAPSNLCRLKQESRQRWHRCDLSTMLKSWCLQHRWPFPHRNQKKYETLPKSEQEEVREHCRQSSAAYWEKHRDELQAKEWLHW